MRSYQTIILIGSILGILITIGTAFIMSSLTTFVGDSNPNSQEQANTVYLHVGSGLLIYIIILIIAFAVNNSKAVGIITIISSFLVFLATGAFGILGFALLLAGGIVALAHKRNNSSEEKTIDNARKNYVD